MASAPATLTDRQRATLGCVCDTFLPAIGRADDQLGFWARAGSDAGIPAAMEFVFGELPAEQLDGLRAFLDLLDDIDLASAPPERREQMLSELGDFNPTKPGFHALRSLSTLLFYALPDESGGNPTWPTLGYPGPPDIPPAEPSNLRILKPDEHGTIAADVCVVGSGAGGSVVAAELAMRGLNVVVLEAGAHYQESAFTGLELVAYRQLYLRGGPFATDDGQVVLLAGSVLGGGTRVNYTNCLRPPASVREEWERNGLAGLSSQEFDDHLDRVLERIGATDELSDLNGPHQRLKEGCDALGYSFKTAARNADRASYDPASAGFMGFGDRSGSKLDATRTWLVDACNHGARLFPCTRAERILIENGRAVGVSAANGVVVRAPVVVVACGALESPALLARSQIGGPACGAHLRLHPAGVILGVFDEPQDGWWGAPQAGLCDQFSDRAGGGGFVIECPHVSTGAAALSIPWRSGRQHKERVSQLSRVAALSSLVRDQGSGSVELDSSGSVVVRYPLDDPRDVRSFRDGLAEMARILCAAGAREILAQDRNASVWKHGEDLDGFLAQLESASLAPLDYPMFSGHQMGTCSMGSDPATSVADPRGELHDTPGVWIADASAFPSSCAVNPMVTIMALARRTAQAIAE